MAKYYSSTFGKISGKLGSAVAVIRKDGSTYLRLHVPASNPRTDKQQAHRAKFALTSKSLVPFNPIFKQTIGITNGISTARSYAFKNAIVGEYPSLSMDYEKIMFSFGALEKLHDSSVAINEGVMTVNWSFKEMYNCHGDDSVSFIIFNKDRKQSLHIENVAMRSDKLVKMDIYDSWADCDLCLWAYVRGGDKISDSVFVAKRSAELEADVHAHIQDDGADGSVEIDRCDYTEKESNIVSPIQPLVNKIIVSFIVLIYSLIDVFQHTVTGSKTIAVVSDSVCNGFRLLCAPFKVIGGIREVFTIAPPIWQPPLCFPIIINQTLGDSGFATLSKAFVSQFVCNIQSSSKDTNPLKRWKVHNYSSSPLEAFQDRMSKAGTCFWTPYFQGTQRV